MRKKSKRLVKCSIRILCEAVRMFEAAERILCLRAQIARLWQRLLLSATNGKKRERERETRCPQWEKARRKRTHSRRRADSSHGLVKSARRRISKGGSFCDRRAQKDSLLRVPHPLLFAPRDKQIVCTLQHAKIAPTFPLVGLRFVGEIRKIARVTKQEGQAGALGICGRAKNGKADRDLMGNFT